MKKQLAKKKVVILDGTRHCDQHLDTVFAQLTTVLQKQQSFNIQIFRLREITLAPCIGCFNCWVKTPGKCIYKDRSADIIREILKSDALVLFTPVIFGGYSSELKKMIDRFLLLTLPIFKTVQNETNHPSRYPKIPHFVGVGVQSFPQREQSLCFKTLVERNAMNVNTTVRAETVCCTDSPEALRAQFRSLFNEMNQQSKPSAAEINKLQINPAPPLSMPTNNKRALLIVGSPKVRSSSTSEVLGKYLLKKLEKYGWKTESLILNSQLLHSKKEQAKLCYSVDQADTILFSFPLYVDTLPFLAIKALEIIAHHKKITGLGHPTLFAAMVNTGFPEQFQGNAAISICHFFSLQCGMTWAGGLVFGAGEMLISGNPLKGFRGFRGTKRPPLFYVAWALKMTAAALANGRPVPQKAVQLIAKNPVPFIPSAIWHWFLIRKGNSLLKNEAVKNGLDIKSIYDQPYK